MSDRDKLVIALTSHISNEKLASYVNDNIDCDDCPFKDDCRNLKVIRYGMCESYVLDRLNKGKK